MKVKIDDEEFFEITEIKKKVIKNDIPDDIFDEDIKRRIKYVIDHKYEQCLERLKKEWIPKLKNSGIESIPLNDDEFSELVFSQKEYKNRSEREKKQD
jgi:hypothetical protein